MYGYPSYSIGDQRSSTWLRLSARTNTESTKKEENRMTNRRTYEVVRDDQVHLLEGVTYYTSEEQLLSFHGPSSETGSDELIHAFHLDTVLSFRPVPEAEKPITPKHLYRVTLTKGWTKDVRADLYRLTTQGETQVYEFFSRVSRTETREELTIPAASVEFVERVDTEEPDVKAPAEDGNVGQKPEPEQTDSVDYVEAVRPKRH